MGVFIYHIFQFVGKMEAAIISFLGGAIFSAFMGYYIYAWILKPDMQDMINDKSGKYIQDLEFELSYLERKNYILERKSVKIIEKQNTALHERDEALLMLSKKLTNDT